MHKRGECRNPVYACFRFAQRVKDPGQTICKSFMYNVVMLVTINTCRLLLTYYLFQFVFVYFMKDILKKLFLK